MDNFRACQGTLKSIAANLIACPFSFLIFAKFVLLIEIYYIFLNVYTRPHLRHLSPATYFLS